MTIMKRTFPFATVIAALLALETLWPSARIPSTTTILHATNHPGSNFGIARNPAFMRKSSPGFESYTDSASGETGFVARREATSLMLTPTEAIWHFGSGMPTLRMRFVGATPRRVYT